jgi:hypothetical protein
VRLEGLGKLKKKSAISSGKEPATCQLVAKCLQQLHYYALSEKAKFKVCKTKCLSVVLYGCETSSPTRLTN